MDQYDPIRVLGEGSFGKVYLMRDKVKRNFVCVKVIKIKNIPKKERDACRMEVELLRRLHHPNIVSYIDSFLNRTKDSLCIVMQYCDGGDLAAQIKAARHRRFSERKILHWFVQIALGMHYMHSNRVLHRDLKTQNIFLLGNGRLVLGDLGISKVMDGTMDFAKTCIGTPYYMSPEIFQNKPYNHKSDVWALGCVLYELTTLNHAFDANSLNGLACKIVKGRYPPVDPKYSTHLRDLIAAMLMTNPSQRPDMDDVLRRPFIRKHIYNFLSDIVSRPASNIGDGTMAVRAAAVNAVGAADGYAASILAQNPDVRALKAQLESLNLQSVISKALAPPEVPTSAGAASPVVAKRLAREQAGALKREQEHKRMVEAALQKLREEREKRNQQRYQPAKESSSSSSRSRAPAPQSSRRGEPIGQPRRAGVPGYAAPNAAANVQQSRRVDAVADARSGISSKRNAVRPVVAPRVDPSEADRRRVEDLDRWEEKQQEHKRDDIPAKEVPSSRQQPSKLQQEIEELRRAKAFLDKREQRQAEKRERERRQKLSAESNAPEPRLQRDSSDSTAASAPVSQMPQQLVRRAHRPHAHSSENNSVGERDSDLSARDRVLMQKREREAKAEADRLEALRAAANDNRVRRQQAYKQGRDQYASQLEGRKAIRPADAESKNGPTFDNRPAVAPDKESADSLEFEATAKAGSPAPNLANAIAAASDVDAILGDDEENDVESDEWEAEVVPENAENYEEDLEQQLEEELMHATLRVEHLQKTLHATKSMMHAPKTPIEAVQEENGEDDEGEDDEDDDDEEEEVEPVTTYNMFSQPAAAPPSYHDLSDRPSSKGMLGDRIRKLKERCVAGLGLETFQKAYDFLQRLASEDTMVAGYEENEQNSIKANTLSVLLGRNAHFAPLIEQILFMEETQGV